MKLTKEQSQISKRNYKKATLYFNLQKGYVLHHINPSWRHEDVERYIQWNPEDLQVMTKAEHISLHHKGVSTWSKGLHLSEEHKRNIGKANKGHPVSEETRRKISEASKGKIISDETKQKMSEAKKGKPSNSKGKKWYTNGVNSIMLHFNDVIPEGYHPGRTIRSR